MIEEFHQWEPYALGAEEKSRMLTKELTELTRFHRARCPEYAGLLKTLDYREAEVRTPEDVPFFPVRLFKEFDLLSVPREEVFKTMTSSGTTGQRASKIFADKETAMLQQKVMLRILSDFWGKGRLPMLVVDAPSVLKDRRSFTARGAAIMGLQFAAREMVFILNEDMTLNVEKLREFTEKYRGKRFVIFGFTFLVWRHFYQELTRLGEQFDFSEAFLMTGGGWKKLESEAVSQEEFQKRLREVCGLRHFLDHYGMVEQTGAIYAECECGHLHASIYSDVIIRDYRDLSPLPIGRPGIVQVVSVLPRSYPGHSLLTEDEGVVLGEDDCPCGRKGKYIRILGRMKSAELRGCSDTYGAEFQ